MTTWTPATSALWLMAQEADDTRARQLRAHARELGASAVEVARWWSARDRWLTGGVQVLGGDGMSAPCARCDQYREDYEILRDAVIDHFNPPDDDIAEVAIMLGAIEVASEFIAGLPCYCSPAAADLDDDPCGRCEALGRVSDVAVER